MNKLWDGENKYDGAQQRGTYLYVGEKNAGKFYQKSVGKGRWKQINSEKSVPW